MSKKEARRDFLIGLFTVIAGLFIRLYAIPRYIVTQASSNELTAGDYPAVCSYLLILFGTCLIIRTILVEPRVMFTCWRQIAETFRATTQTRRNVLVSMGIALLYYVIIITVRNFTDISGFYVAAPICMILLGIWLNWKKLWVLLITTAATTVSIYYVFWHILDIRIP